MIAKYVQAGKLLDYLSTSDVSAGAIIPLGNNFFAIAPIDIPKNTLGGVHVTGVVRIPKAAGVAIAKGALVYWTGSTTNTAGTTSVSNGYIGRAAVPALAGDETVDVLLNASNIGAFTAFAAGTSPAAVVVDDPTTATITGTSYTGQPAIIKAAIDQNATNITALKTGLAALVTALEAAGIIEA